MVRLVAPSGIVKGSNSLGGVLVNHMLTALGTPYLVAATGVFSQITVFLFAAADLLAMVFMKSDDLAGLRLASECIRISCLSLPFHSVVYLFNNYLMAAKKLHFSSLYSFLIEYGVMVPVTFFMIAVFGYRGAWIAKAASMLVLMGIAVVYVSLHKGPTFADKMLLLPESFGITRENEIAMIAASTKGLVWKDKDLIVRLRDDCRPFNVTEYYELMKNDPDKEKEISLAIIMNTAKDVKYTTAFGANNLIVRI